MKSRHAVVIGGSIGGLCAARVLSDHFERVTVIDHDKLSSDADHRKGVPQSRHPHALLDRGRRELSALFPGFDEMMLARGALDVDPSADMAMLQPNGWGERRRTHRFLMFASRILIESVIRELVGKFDRINCIQETEVSGLRLADGASRRVTGVDLADHAGGRTAAIDADLVIDASGRGSRIPQWLGALGFPAVPQEIVDADAGYSTVWYQAPPPSERPAKWWWKAAFLNPSFEAFATRPEDLYFGLLFPVENDRWLITVASWGGRPLPRDHESFAALLGRLRSPLLADSIAIAEPISPVFYRRGMQNIWNHYENWNGNLAGFLATADAACAFNPVYGQGMSSASVCATILGQALREGDPTEADFATNFHKKQAEFLRGPWSLAVARDRQALGGAEDQDPTQKMAAEAFARIMTAGRSYPEISEAIFDIFNLNRTPESLMTDPSILSVLTKILQSPPEPQPQTREITPYPPEAISG